MRNIIGPYQTDILSNGLRVIQAVHPLCAKRHIQVEVSVGARDDPAGKGGSAHALEHIIAGTIQKGLFGVHLNDSTTTSHATSFPVRVPFGFEQDFFSRLRSAFTARSYSDSIIGCEVGRILREFEESPDEYFMLVDKLLAPEYLTPILGDDDFVAGIVSEDLVEFRDQNYSGSKIIVSIVGSDLIPTAHLEKYLGKDFLNNGSLREEPAAFRKASGSNHQDLTEDFGGSSDIVTLAIGLPVVHQDEAIVDIAGSTLYNYMQRILSDINGKVYSIERNVSKTATTQVEIYQVTCEMGTSDIVYGLITDSLRDVCHGDFSDSDFYLAVEDSKDEAYDLIRNPDSLCTWLIDQIDGRMEIQQYLSSLDSVTKKEVVRYAKEWFSPWGGNHVSMTISQELISEEEFSEGSSFYEE